MKHGGSLKHPPLPAMPPPWRSRAGAPRRLKAGWVFAAVVAAMLMFTGKVFVAPQHHAGQSSARAPNYGRLPTAAPAQAGAGVGGSQRKSGVSVTGTFGVLALLCASAVVRDRRIQSKSTRSACSGGWTVCASAPALAPADPVVSSGAAVHSLIAPSTQHVFIGEETPTLISTQAVASGTPKADSLLEGLQWYAEAESPAPASAFPAFAARFIGGSRHSFSRRQAHAAPRSGKVGCRAARRSVGARLQRGVQHETPPVPFDPSTLRMKIQLGLRIRCSVCSESWRAGKSMATGKGSDISTDVRIQANAFEHSRNQS